MTDEMLDALARQVLLDASGLGCSDAEQAEAQHAFSPSFERKMKKLIRRADHPVRYRVTQAVACAALVIFLGGGSVLAFSAEARAAVFGWVREVYETYFVYRYEGAETIIPEESIFIPTWLPEGYEMEVEPKPGGMVTSVYRNNAGQRIILTCNYNTESSLTHVVTDGAAALPTFVNGIPADFYYDAEEGDSSILVWHDEEIGAMFQISAALPQEDMIKIAESITEVIYEQPTPENILLCPTWIPEGYEMTIEPELGSQVSAFFENKDGNHILFGYSNTDHNTYSGLFITTEGVVSQSVEMNGSTADLYLDTREGEPNVIVWTVEETGFIFFIQGNLPAEDLIKMAESVDKYEEKSITIENTAFRPTWLPQGYEVHEEPNISGQVIIVYLGTDDQFLHFGYSDNRDGLELILENNSDMEHIQVQVGNTPADLYLDHGEGDANALVWTDKENGIIFWIHAHLSGEDMIRMAESIELTKVS